MVMLNEVSSELQELKHLFFVLIRLDTQTTVSLRGGIEEAGGNWEVLISLFNEYLVGKPDDSNGAFKRLLQERAPVEPAPLNIPDYKADSIPRSFSGGTDLLGIQDSVDAFAYLFASRGLAPPLAVGLFGDWGSGKSFYMQSIKNRISDLVDSIEETDQPQNALLFWKNIVQIEFNAWHYVEGNLWASLVEHIFKNLRLSKDDGDEALSSRERHYIEKLRTLRHANAEAQAEKDSLESELQDVNADIDSIRKKREAALRDIQEYSAEKDEQLRGRIR